MDALQQEHMYKSMGRDERTSRLAGFLERGRKAATREKVEAFVAAHPNAPSREMYDYDLMFREGKMPEPDSEGNFGFLPEEGYKLPGRGKSPIYGFGPLMSYDVNSKNYQFRHTIPRTIAMGLKGAAEGVVNKVTEGTRAALSSFDEPKFDAIVERMEEAPLLPAGETVANLRGREDETIAAASEQLFTELVEIGVDILGAKATIGSKAGVNFAAGKGAFRNMIRRLEESVTPAVVGGEMMYAINPDNKGTMASMLGEELEQTWGMEGPLIEWMKTTDDNAYSQTVAAVIEGMMLYEIGRTAIRTGVRVPAKFWQFAKSRVESARNLQRAQTNE